MPSHRPIAVVLLLTVTACGSYTPSAPSEPVIEEPQPPTGPSGTAPPLPVDARNVRFVSPPSTAPISAADPMVGRYTLDIVVAARSGLRCETVPESARRRRYTADLVGFGDSYAVHLSDATFLADSASVGFGCRDQRLPPSGVCNQFLISRPESSTLSVTMVPEDEWRGSEIWEVMIPEGRLLSIHGRAAGSLREGRIEATGNGGLWYGNGLPATSFAACGGGDGDLQLTFTRR